MQWGETEAARECISPFVFRAIGWSRSLWSCFCVFSLELRHAGAKLGTKIGGGESHPLHFLSEREMVGRSCRLWGLSHCLALFCYAGPGQISTRLLEGAPLSQTV